MGRRSPAIDRAELLRLMVDASALVRRDINATLAEAGLTEPMITMLWVLRPSTPMSMRELADKLGYDPSNISLLGDRLEALGLVERKPHPSDGRRRVLTLTRAGEALYQRTLDHLYERSPLFQLSPREQEQLLDLLAKVERSAQTAAE